MEYKQDPDDGPVAGDSAHAAELDVHNPPSRTLFVPGKSQPIYDRLRTGRNRLRTTIAEMQKAVEDSLARFFPAKPTPPPADIKGTTSIDQDTLAGELPSQSDTGPQEQNVEEEEVIDVEQLCQSQRQELGLDIQDDDDQGDDDDEDDGMQSEGEAVELDEYPNSLHRRQEVQELQQEAREVAMIFVPEREDERDQELQNLQIDMEEEDEEDEEQDAVFIPRPRYVAPPLPDNYFLDNLERRLRNNNVDLEEYARIGDEYVDEAFQRQFTIKHLRDCWTLPRTEPFTSVEWMNPESRNSVSEWGKVRTIRTQVWNGWAPRENAYKNHMSEMSLTTYLKSFLRNSFPNIFSEDESYDYPAILEVVRAYGLEYLDYQDFSIVNIGDSDNVVDNVYKDIGRGKPVFSYTVLDHPQTEPAIDGLYQCAEGYRWSLQDMQTFKMLFGKRYLESSLTTASTPRVHLIYHKMKINAQDSDRAMETNQCRMVYCTITLATLVLKRGGSIIINASRLGYDGFFASLMFLLSLLFESVHIKKPVASLDATVEVWIVAKNYLGADQRLRDWIQRGNATNILSSSRYPLTRNNIPVDFERRVNECVRRRCQWVIRPNLRNLALIRRRDDPLIENQKTQLKMYTVIRWMSKVEMEDLIYQLPIGHPAERRRPIPGVIQATRTQLPGIELEESDDDLE